MKNQKVVISFLSVLFCSLTLMGYSLMDVRGKGLLTENVDALASPENHFDIDSDESECARRGGVYNEALVTYISTVVIGEEIKVVKSQTCEFSRGHCCIGGYGM